VSGGGRHWPSLAVVVAALGLVLLQSVLLVSSLEGYGLADGRQIRLIPLGKILVWSGWFLTLLLAGLALYPARD
jgi:hypothetical protein